VLQRTAEIYGEEGGAAPDERSAGPALAGGGGTQLPSLPGRPVTPGGALNAAGISPATASVRPRVAASCCLASG
jgi:hypothetical protein